MRTDHPRSNGSVIAPGKVATSARCGRDGFLPFGRINRPALIPDGVDRHAGGVSYGLDEEDPRFGRHVVSDDPHASRSERRATALRQRNRHGKGHLRCHDTRGDGVDSQQPDGSRAHDGHQRDRHLQLHQRRAGQLPGQGHAAGLQGVPADRRAGHAGPGQPCRCRARTGRAHRDGDRRLGIRAAPDRQVRSEHAAQVRSHHQPAAGAVPELPEPDEPGARRDADAVPERADRLAGPLAAHLRQRAEPQQQQHQVGRRHQRQPLAAASRDVCRAGRDHRHGERLDQQLRRRAGHGRRRGDHA